MDVPLRPQYCVDLMISYPCANSNPGFIVGKKDHV